ncbi:hypothetical protein Cgig2_000195 [Carnegiea gigantea]|uniref:Uncharacterized protein n=1 Tax=Carnegiea gigantea TaxID=171969 RepID=A0A9Q1KM17_9CARY|nr:hypothetical protein Cgig2_000195 [Carnegiea gigantea]
MPHIYRDSIVVENCEYLCYDGCPGSFYSIGIQHSISHSLLNHHQSRIYLPQSLLPASPLRQLIQAYRVFQLDFELINSTDRISLSGGIWHHTNFNLFYQICNCNPLQLRSKTLCIIPANVKQVDQRQHHLERKNVVIDKYKCNMWGNKSRKL